MSKEQEARLDAEAEKAWAGYVDSETGEYVDNSSLFIAGFKAAIQHSLLAALMVAAERVCWTVVERETFDDNTWRHVDWKDAHAFAVALEALRDAGFLEEPEGSHGNYEPGRNG